MIKGFRDFLLRGNVVEIAVAFVVGAAFNQVVKALVDGLITPLVAAVFGKPDISGVGTFTLNGAEFSIGLILQAALNFLLVAAAVYFVIVMPTNRIMSRFKTEPDVSAPVRDCPECLSSIPVSASRCAFCTAAVTPTAPAHV